MKIRPVLPVSGRRRRRRSRKTIRRWILRDDRSQLLLVLHHLLIGDPLRALGIDQYLTGSSLGIKPLGTKPNIWMVAINRLTDATIVVTW